MTSIALLCVVLLTSCSSVLAQDSAVFHSEHVRVSWLAPQSFGLSPTTIGLRFELQPGWHIYWKNPGDSGAAPKFTFSANGVHVGAIHWPYPTRLPVAHLTNLGYTEEVTFPLTVEPQPGSTLQIEATLEWLVCKDLCIPEFGTLTLQRPINVDGPYWDEREQAMLAQAQGRVPGSAVAAPWRITSAQLRPGAVQVNLAPSAVGHDIPTVFPLAGDMLSPGMPHTQRTPHGVEMTFALLSDRPTPAQLQFVLVADDRAWESTAVLERPASQSAADALPAGTSRPSPDSAENALPRTNTGVPPRPTGEIMAGRSSAHLPLGLLLGAALVGGLVLNLMPCVFPVLVIKLLALVQVEQTPTRRLYEGLGYTLGVLTAFGALGAVFLTLRATGVALGWGFQLQSPVIVLGLIVVFWLMALNLLGVFEWGMGLMSLAGRQRTTGLAPTPAAFLTGMLTVFVAAPCTGPFMGSAVGAAATLPAHEAMAIFLGLGSGLALPFLAVACFPAATRWLPRAGPWMETLKHACAFPLFATVVWLLWVLGRQTGSEGWLLAAMLLLVLSFSLWLGRFTARTMRGGAWALALAALLYAGVQVRALTSAAPVTSAGAWVPYEQALLNQTRVRKQAVFVDFTAAWCITCQVNKLAVLETAAARALFQARDVLLMRGDWTTHEPRITEALAAFGRTSVPLYVFYPADGSAPRILPPLLTLSALEAALNP